MKADPIPVRTDVRDHVAVIALTRPERLNAINYELMAGLRDALLDAGGRKDVRAVVLRGEGRAFCVGLDLETGLSDPSISDPLEALHAAMRLGVDLIWAMRTIPQPVIAAVQGHAVGAGFAFAAAADVRFIAPDATFSAPFLELGVSVGDLGLTWFLPRIIGLGRATQLFFSAGTLDAEQAVRSGLAPHVSDDPLAEALRYADHVASFPTYGVGVSKDLISASASASLRGHLDAEARAQVIGALTAGGRSAMGSALKRTKTKEE